MTNVLRACTLIFLLSATHSSVTQEQTYPNLQGTTLLEDDRVVVQHFVLQPGHSEGVHAHPQYQLVVVLNQTEELLAKFGEKEYVFHNTPGGMNAFWRPGPVTVSQNHDSTNGGTEPLEWIAISFKKESIATDRTPNIFENREHKAP